MLLAPSGWRQSEKQLQCVLPLKLNYKARQAPACFCMCHAFLVGTEFYQSINADST